MKMISPIKGTVVCLTDEKLQKKRNLIKCIISAPADHVISVNDQPCSFDGNFWTTEVELGKEDVALTATDHSTNESESVDITIFYTENKLFRVSVDDGIWFLQDIARNNYDSIFENPYLAMLKRLHLKYRAKFHVNIYYTCPEHGGFFLTELSDRYKDPWLEALDWLVLSFHARADIPGYPYLNSDRETTRSHCLEVYDQIDRFAGYRSPVTTLHYAETTKEGVKGLYDCGIRALLGDYSYNRKGERQLCYGATEEEFLSVRRNCFYRDPETNMIMFCCDAVLNCFSPDEVSVEMERFDSLYPDRSFIDILIHEQYFYNDYKHYLPDYEERIASGIRWCLEHGYKPGLVRDIIDFSKL